MCGLIVLAILHVIAISYVSISTWNTFLLQSKSKLMQALKKQKEEEMRIAEAKKKERAVQIHKEWLEKKKVEAQKKKEAEHKQMIKQKEMEDQVSLHTNMHACISY